MYKMAVSGKKLNAKTLELKLRVHHMLFYFYFLRKQDGKHLIGNMGVLRQKW